MIGQDHGPARSHFRNYLQDLGVSAMGFTIYLHVKSLCDCRYHYMKVLITQVGYRHHDCEVLLRPICRGVTVIWPARKSIDFRKETFEIDFIPELISIMN